MNDEFVYQEGALNVIDNILKNGEKLSVVNIVTGNSFALDHEAIEAIKSHYINKATELNRLKVKRICSNGDRKK